MADIVFFKYQGTGNDFIIVDNRDGKYSQLDEAAIRKLCARRLGIGADGLMMLEKHPNCVFDMKYFNADGKPSTMCGNGGRCIVAFAYALGVIDNTCTFHAVDGLHNAQVLPDNTIRLSMGNVNRVLMDGPDYILDTGSPHFVRIVDTDLSHMDIVDIGKSVRYSDTYRAEGINVNIINIFDNNHLQIRTYERGVEDETLSCGTGVTASAIVLAHHQNFDDGQYDINVSARGGQLNVDFKKNGALYSDIHLTGPATMVYRGQIDLDQWLQV